MSQHIYENVIDNILAVKKREYLGSAVWEAFYDAGKSCKKCGKSLRILLIVVACNGFGDLIFALKLSSYLKEWYDADITIATTSHANIISLGADPSRVVALTGKKSLQCRRLGKLTLTQDIPQQDLLFIAPMQMDFDMNLRDVQRLIPYANELNTFSFSEYNDSLDKHFTFNTGVGRDRDGVLLTKPTMLEKKPKSLKNPFILIYVAGTVDRVDECIMNFVEMVAKKYHIKHTKLDIVVPNWFPNDIDLDRQLNRRISRYYPNIFIMHKNKDGHIEPDIVIAEGERYDNTLTFRADILPVPNKMMMTLMRKSLDDILLTGDQSITDALSCCSQKNIFYQQVPWKRDFALQLAKAMPNIYLKSIKTTCGSLKAVKYHSKYGKFVKEWDFRSRARGKLDAIVLSIIAMSSIPEFAELYDIVTSTRTLQGIKTRLTR
jgi:hypothetical protein